VVSIVFRRDNIEGARYTYELELGCERYSGVNDIRYSIDIRYHDVRYANTYVSPIIIICFE